MRRLRALEVLAAVTLGVPWLAGVARAHEIAGSRFDAPLPLPLLFGSAGVTVAATAWWLASTDRDPSDSARSDQEWTLSTFSIPAPSSGRAVLRLAGLLGFAAVLYFGLFGTGAAADNPATLFAWAVALKGVGLVSVVAGSPWRWLSPWRTVYEGFVALEGREIAPFEYPDWLGAWPAVLGFVAVVGVGENLTEIPQSPRLTAGVLAAYALVMVAGGLAFGSDWFRNADALEVLYRLLGCVSPLDWTERSVGLRAPWQSCSRRPERAGIAAFVVAAVYTVSFDGFSNTPEYQTLYFAVRESSGVYTPLVLYFAGLAGFLVAYQTVAILTEHVGASDDVTSDDGTDDDGTDDDGTDDVTNNDGARDDGAGQRLRWRDAAAAFAPTVVPIAAAYEVAHNYPFVARNLSALLSLVDGVSVSLLGWLPLSVFWWSQVALVVAGHLLAVAAAHRVAVRRYGGRAGRAHVPFVALMVGYTVLSLWIVSRPVVA